MSFQEFIDKSITLIGKTDTDKYLENISLIIEHPQFYIENCKILFMDYNLEITNAAKKFKTDSLWASFHPDWETNFGVFVIRKNTKEVHFTRNLTEVYNILEEQICVPTTFCMQDYMMSEFLN
jgi:hypothetical protein